MEGHAVAHVEDVDALSPAFAKNNRGQVEDAATQSLHLVGLS
jgi:hypothetical protein